ncbi:MAG: hypothetical protein ACP5IL_14450 [Syntrophobacteraceae bacterium]
MKKSLAVLTVLLAVCFFAPHFVGAQQQAAPMGPGWYCPYARMGGGGAMMGGGGGMMRHGRGCGMGPAGRLNGGNPLSEDQARTLVQNYLASGDVAGLKLGAITDKGNAFEAVVTNKENSPVEKIQVDKKTGWFKNIPS